jgi:hypothetical protein
MGGILKKRRNAGEREIERGMGIPEVKKRIRKMVKAMRALKKEIHLSLSQKSQPLSKLLTSVESLS